MSQPITSGTITITNPDIRNQTPVGGPNYAYYSSGVTYYDYDDGNLPTGPYTAAGAYTPATGIKGILYLGYRNITRPLNSSYNSWYGDYKITQLAIWRKLGLRTSNSGYGSGVWDSAGSLMTTGSNLSQTAYPVSTVGVYKFTRTNALILIGTSNVVKLTVATNGGTATTYAGLSYVYLPQSVSTTLPPAISRGNSGNQNSYTVAYQANGGSSTPSTQTSTKYYSYTFSKWQVNSTNYNASGSITLSDSATATAQWTSTTHQNAVTLAAKINRNNGTSTRTVSFNVNGGSGTVNSLNSTATVTYAFSKWQRTSDNATYNAGASFTPSANTTMKATWTSSTGSFSAITLPAAPTAPTGKYFTGWYTASSGGTKAGNAGASYTPDQTRTLYAQWAYNTYTISYNGNGNTGGTVPASQTKTYGTALTLRSAALTKSDTNGYTVSFNINGGSGTTPSNIIQKVGYTDNGWNTNSSGTGTHYADGGSYTTNAAATLYCQWTVTRKSITLPAAPTAPTGKHFTGWYTASSGGTKRGDAGGTYTPTASETLYAQWAYNTYTITFNANGGTLGTPTTQTKTYGTNLTLRAGCTRSNSSASNSYTVSYNANGGSSTPSAQTNTKYTAYSFSKWNTQSDGTGTNYNAGGTYSANAAATLYAQWSTSTVQNAITLASAITHANSSTLYTITFNANGGSVSPSSATSTATITYAFEKWHLNSASGTGYSAGASYTPSANCTMYAGWTPTTGTYSAVSLPTPTRTGFTCSGWYTDSSGGTKRGDAGGSYTPTASETLYPHWTANTYTMSYALGGGTHSHGSNYQYQSGNYTYIMNPTNVAYDMSNFTDTLNSPSGINPNFMIQQATKTGYINDYWTITGMDTNTHYFYYDDGNGRTAQASTSTSITTNWATASATDQYRPLCRYLRATSGTVTATAHWTPITYTVVFKSGNTELGTQSFTYDTAQNLTAYANLTAPSTPSTTYGWSFYGWATNYNTTTRNYVDGASANNLTSTNGATVTLYAIYKRNITFKYYNSASATSVTTDTNNIQYYINSSTTAAGGTSVTVPALYANSTYGWAPYGWIRNANTYTAASGFPTDGSSTSVTPSVTLSPLLYALYTRTVTLNYNANGGSGTTTATTGAQRRNANNTNAETITLITAISTFTPPAGYAFDKWNTANDASGTDYAEGASYSWSNVAWTSAKTNTLYAIYKPHALVHFYQDSNNQWKPAFVYVWNSTNSEWELTMPYGYTSNGWKVGGPQ